VSKRTTTEPISTCPTCGCPVRIGGEGTGPGSTHYYVPILPDEVKALVKASKRLTTIMSPNTYTKCAFSVIPIDCAYADTDKAIKAVERILEGK
jgi:hypothetical protein